MCQYLRAGEVVDSNHIDALHVIDFAENQSADATKAIDGYFYGTHVSEF
jgi:hypothetical protein